VVAQLKIMKEIVIPSANDITLEPVILDDPQYFDEYFGIDPRGGVVDIQSWWILKDIKESLPQKKDDLRTVELKAFQDSTIDYSPLLKLTAGMLDGLDAIDEDTSTVFTKVIHARVLAQLGIPFDTVPPQIPKDTKNADQSQDTNAFEDSPMNNDDSLHRDARLASDLPTKILENFDVPHERAGETTIPIFIRERRDLRSRRRVMSLV